MTAGLGVHRRVFARIRADRKTGVECQRWGRVYGRDGIRDNVNCSASIIGRLPTAAGQFLRRDMSATRRNQAGHSQGTPKVPHGGVSPEATCMGIPMLGPVGWHGGAGRESVKVARARHVDPSQICATPK